MSFSQKCLKATFNFADGTTYTTPTSLRMSARIATAGGDHSGKMTLAIFGLTMDHMNKCSVLPFTATAVGANSVTLYAGENGTAETLVFQGTIQFAAHDFSNQPDVLFRVEANAGLVEAVKPVAPTTSQGSTDGAQLMGVIAQKMGRSLENGGVGLKISNPYFSGAAKSQASKLARALGIQWVMDGSALAIWPANQPRSGTNGAVTISPSNGMVGFPTFSASGVVVTTEFQGAIKYGIQVNIESSLTQACGSWYITYMEHALDAYTTNGRWFTTLTVGRINPN